jgi:hypothetical protein
MGLTQSAPKRDWVYTQQSHRFDLGYILNIMPEFKRLGRLE